MVKKNKTCVICGRELRKKKKILCGSTECLKKYTAEYIRKYRNKEENKERVAKWINTSYNNYREKHPIIRKNCVICGKIVEYSENNKRKYCLKCFPESCRRAFKKYYYKNKEKEKIRKAKWYQNRKKLKLIKKNANKQSNNRGNIKQLKNSRRK